MASLISILWVCNELYDRVTLMITMFAAKVFENLLHASTQKETFQIMAGCLRTRANSPMTGAPITTKVSRQKVAAGKWQDLSTSPLRLMFRV